MERAHRSRSKRVLDPFHRGSVDVGVESAVLDRIELTDVSPMADVGESLYDVAGMPSVALLDYSPNASISARIPLPAPPPPQRSTEQRSQEPLWRRHQRMAQERANQPRKSARDRARSTGRRTRKRPAKDRDWDKNLAKAGMPTCRLCGTHNRREAVHCARCRTVLERGSGSGSGTGSLPARRSLAEILSPLAVAAVVLTACGFLFSLV